MFRPLPLRRLVRAAAGAALVLGVAAPVPALAASSAGPVVHIRPGAVQGTSSQGVDSFLGIRYAQAPVGRLRWRPPQPVAPWSGVRPATAYGDRCAALASTNGPLSTSEDCLFVNVQRPTGASAGARLPVYVFIHGGGLVNGSSNQASGDKIVRRTGVIVVSMNYRLGVFGFLGLPGLRSTGGDGDYGLLDQQAALRWVQANIGAFGGDPSRVTVGGESAGGFSVCAHLTAPGSRGLFAQAMMQSWSCLSRTRAQTEAASEPVVQAVGCASAADQPACLRSRPTLQLLRAGAGFSPTITSGTSVLPTPPLADVTSGNFARVPLVVGDNRDEGRTFTQGNIGWTRAQYLAWLRATFGARAAEVRRQYPWPAHANRYTAAYLTGAITTDAGLAAGIGGCTDLALTGVLAQYTPTYSYEFDARRGPGLVDLGGYVWGAGHAAELAYLFPSFDNGTPIAPTFDAAERRLSRDMVDAWGGFVSAGTPGPVDGRAWPRFDTTGRIMSLRPGGASRTISTAAYRAEHRCGFWDSLPAA